MEPKINTHNCVPFWYVLRWAEMTLANGTPAQKSVLNAFRLMEPLAERAGHAWIELKSSPNPKLVEGEYVSARVFAEEFNISERQAARQLAKLRKAGTVTDFKKRPHNTYLYHVTTMDAFAHVRGDERTPDLTGWRRKK